MTSKSLPLAGRPLLLLAAIVWLALAASFFYQGARTLTDFGEMPPLITALAFVAVVAGLILIIGTVRAPRSRAMAQLGQRLGAAPVLLLSLFDLASSGWSKEGAWLWLFGSLLALLLLPLLPAPRTQAR